MSGSSYLSDTLRKNSIDICGLAEHWLFESCLSFIDVIDSTYKSVAVADNDCKYKNSRNVGKGGVALLWHVKHDKYITPLNIDDDRIIGIQYQVSKQQYIFIFQVYLPCSNYSILTFRDYIDKLYNLWSMYSENGTVLFMGDFNAKIQVHSKNYRDMYTLRFINDTNCVAVDTMSFCTGAKHSYVSYDDRFVTLIDHICVPVEKIDCVNLCTILDDNCLNVSRHRPVICSLSLPLVIDMKDDIKSKTRINWKKVTDDEISCYVETLNNTEELLQARYQKIESNDDIDRQYELIVSAITSTSSKSIRKRKFKSFLKPYWNENLSALHNTIKQSREKWLNAGRPKTGNVLFSEYKQAKKKFRKVHRLNVQKFLEMQNDELDKSAEIDHDLFWRIVNSKRKGKGTKAGCEIQFNNIVYRDPVDITKQWKLYFEDLYQPTDNPNFHEGLKTRVSAVVSDMKSHLDTVISSEIVNISPDTIKDLLKTCKRGKMCGHDGIYYEHIIHGGNSLYWAISRLFSAMLNTGHIPSDMNKGVIVTLHKGGKKKKNDPNNYRAITLTSTVLKLFEDVLLHRSKTKMLSKLSPQQGGFQKNLGCIMTSFSLREAILFAKENHSKAYVCFLDCKQAFDRKPHIFQAKEHGSQYYSVPFSSMSKRNALETCASL
ncbi:uncharacterized protein LOC128555985 [Mercenaria mercenaria]|uniref:uncharacterized protein LOC128555985 n=1 Tax=Mercenaria mercenaria TaxID=6596 RepID=UPI00234F40AE|nr:uncharacterized protein LOC128555985 [Mercenaria mercenaria]